METVSVLSSNEVVSCLWNKNAREKCRIGLADIILYEQSAPSKWYFTGKTGEVLKKKTISATSVSERWKKIANSSNSSVIAILRQENGLLKFFREYAWNTWCDQNFSDANSSVLSLHCFVKGNHPLIYRNSFELKDKLGRFVTATRSYKILCGEETTSVGMMTKDDYEFTDLKASSIKSVMDLATSTIIKYVEMMLQVKVLSISIDYVIDTKSQLWVLWTSDARVRHTVIESRSRTSSPERASLLQESFSDDDAILAPSQVDAALSLISDLRTDTGPIKAHAKHDDGSAGFKATTLDTKRADKCKGDFCSILLESVGSLTSQEEVNGNAMARFFTDEERRVLGKHDKYRELSDLSDPSLQYDFVPMRTVLRVREERKRSRLSDGHKDTWKEYPTSPRDDANVFIKWHAKERSELDNSMEEHEKRKLSGLAQDKQRREEFNIGMLSYYDSVKVCPTCYKVYLLLDWAREVLALEKRRGSLRSRSQSDKDAVLALTEGAADGVDSADTAAPRPLIRAKKTSSPVRKKKASTWKKYAASETEKDNSSSGFLNLDNYLRGRGGPRESKVAMADGSKEIPENLYRGTVMLAFNDTSRSEGLGTVLRDAYFNVCFCQDGREVLNEVVSKHEGGPRRRFDCIVLQKDLSLVDAFDVARRIRDFERELRQQESAELAAGGVGKPTKASRTALICCSPDTSPDSLRALMRADMDGCVSEPVDPAALLNTVKAAIPHHLALLTALQEPTAATQRVYRLGPMGIKEGANDSSASAYKGLSTAKSKEDDCAYNGLAQLDADTLLPFVVMDASRQTNAQVKNRQSVFNLVVCHDLFDTAERLKIFLRPIVTKYAGMQVLLWNYPGQAFTEWRSEQLLNNEYHAICLNELLGQIGHLGTGDLDTSHPFYILGYGHGMSVASFFAAHYSVPNLRGIVSVNGWSFLDSYMAGALHDCVNIFECAPPSRPDLPVYFFSRFLFSRDYLTKASVPLALNIYTAVHNPISVKGRVSLCKGVLQLVDTRQVLSEIDVPIVCVQSTQDSFARPLHTEPFVLNRGGEVDSVYSVLQEPNKTCIIWMKAGHEVFQEKRNDILLLMEQLLTGFHETHNVLLPRSGAIDEVQNLDPDVQRAAVNKDIMRSAVEDRFITNVLKNMDKVQASAEHNKTITDALQASSGGAAVRVSDLLKPKSHSTKSLPPAQLGHYTTRPSKDAPVTDPNVWLEYSKNMTETQTVASKAEVKRKAQLAKSESEQLLVLDPTSTLFDRQDTLKRSGSQETLTHKTSATEFPEVKEYMSWRLKRNKRRLQRLQNAARIIQCAFRCYIARQRADFLRRSAAALTIQRCFRGWLGRCLFIERARMLWAVQMVQMYWRGYSARKKHFYLKLEIAAGVTIQKRFRGFRARKLVKAKRRKQHHAASLIQALYRRMQARKDVFRMRLERNKATLIQRVFRGHLGRKKAAAEMDKYIFSRSQTQGIEFGRQMLLEHKLHATKLQSDVALLAQEKVAAEELVEQLLEEISSFEQGVRSLEKDMHRLSKVEADATAFMDDDSKYELREQKMRLDKEFGSMLAKISSRKDALSDLEKKLAMIDKFRLKKEEELRTLERKLVVLLEEQQNELNAIKRKQDIRGNMLIASHDELSNAIAPGGAGAESTALVVGSRGSGGGGGPSVQERRQAAQLMQSTETLMKFGFMSMSMTYFSSLNMIKALRTVSAQDTVMAALADVHAQKAVAFGTEPGGPSSSSGVGAGGNFVPNLKNGQLPGQESLRVSTWSVEDVSKWLDTLSLGQYKEAFIDAAIDGEFLYDLDEEDLKNTLGIEHRLHRKKILNCVQRLKVAEAQHDSKLDALLRETNAMDAPSVAGVSAERSFASMDSGGAAVAAGGEARNEPKITLAELVTLVRHSKYGQVKAALDYLPTKKFDPSVVEAAYIPDYGSTYIDSYERVAFHINRGAEHNNSLLIIAAQNGNIKILKYLVSKGANPNHQTDTGQTAAHFAVEYKFFDISTWLFENGAKDFIENKFGLTPYDGLTRGDDESEVLEIGNQ